MQERILFGTDGIRGEANVYPMTVEVALAVGKALAYLIRRGDLGQPFRQGQKRIVIGKDTRLSGYCFEQALAAGICSMGVDVMLVGPLPTPGIAFITQSMRADAGVVVSASHNPFHDNGIKIFDHQGFKLSDETELLLEQLILRPELMQPVPTGIGIGKAHRVDDAVGRYVVNLKSVFPVDKTLEGVRIVLDCAHGAAYKVAPFVFLELGAEVIVIGAEPDGMNINEGVGALHPLKVQEAVRFQGAQIGILLDGDADRLVLVDERGEVVDGDAVMALLARDMVQKGTLKHRALVTTVMSNWGLEQCLTPLGIEVKRVQVGDRYVVECLKNQGLSMGGEQSGHLVFLEHSTTGDGIVAALKILTLMLESAEPLSRLKQMMQPSPRAFINCEVPEKIPLGELGTTVELIKKIEDAMGNAGRVLVRYSGTEKKIRILVEHNKEKYAQSFAEQIADCLLKEINDKVRKNPESPRVEA